MKRNLNTTNTAKHNAKISRGDKQRERLILQWQREAMLVILRQWRDNCHSVDTLNCVFDAFDRVEAKQTLRAYAASEIIWNRLAVELQKRAELFGAKERAHNAMMLDLAMALVKRLIKNGIR